MPEGFSAGADDYSVQPFTLATLPDAEPFVPPDSDAFQQMVAAMAGARPAA